MSTHPLFILQTGSPLQARLEVNVFSVVLIIIGIFFVIGLVYAVSRMITTYLNSPAYLEKKKNRPTSIKDITEISNQCALVKEERDVLFLICKNHKTPNIKYIVRDYETMYGLFKEQFNIFSTENNEILKTYLFGLQKKIFKVFRQQGLIKNSKNISSGTVFTLTVGKGFHHKLVLADNNAEAMVLTIPPTLKKDSLPKALEKVSFIFELEDGTPYSVETRIVRYQVGKENEDQMVVVHSDKISPLQKREQERAELNLACKYHSVKVVADGNGKKESIKYVPSEKAYDGVIEDISSGGCRLIATLPIKAEQHIYINGPLNGKQNDEAVGTIVRTTKRSDGIYILHIKFIKIDVKVTNRIQAMVYKYDE